MDLAKTLTDPITLLAILVAIAVFATLYTLASPLLERGNLDKRMKAVSTEREQIRARERARMNAEQSKTSLRAQNNQSVRQIVDRFNLREALVDDKTVAKLRAAGLRSQNALNMFLVARFLLPFVFLALAIVWIFVLGNMASKPLPIRMLVAIVVAYVGFYAPNIYVSNLMGKRQASIKRAWPDALDLMPVSYTHLDAADE